MRRHGHPGLTQPLGWTEISRAHAGSRRKRADSQGSPLIKVHWVTTGIKERGRIHGRGSADGGGVEGCNLRISVNTLVPAASATPSERRCLQAFRHCTLSNQVLNNLNELSVICLCLGAY